MIPYQFCVVGRSDKYLLTPIVEKLMAYDVEFKFKVYMLTIVIDVYFDVPQLFDTVRWKIGREIPKESAALLQVKE